jgi:hypothetical protein
MKIAVRGAYIKDFKGKYFEDKLRFHNEDRLVDVDMNLLTEKQVNHIYESAKKNPTHQGARTIITRINAFRAVRANPTGQKITQLTSLPAAIKAYMENSPNKWLFSEAADGFSLPYFVQSVDYSPPGKDTPAYVVVKLCAAERGARDDKSITFHRADLGKNVVALLNEKEYFLETEAAVAMYWKDVETLKNWETQTGKQFHCVGTAFISTSWYSSNNMAEMEREGRPTKVVLDESGSEESRGSSHHGGMVVSTRFWTMGPKAATTRTEDEIDGDEDGDEEIEEEDAQKEQAVDIPVHPYVRVFDLQQHQWLTSHVRNLTEYKYDKEVINKLVLPPNTKDLINILMRGSAEVMEDIISGKTGGTIVISTGPPGTGKTLTAEVFSEEIERPLYPVQCSQLGTDEEKLEKSLQQILQRASRWGAILLIDEADVYVRARGEDIQQNAIVGVFLRVLEYYRGVLFLTSNRETIIDDAVMSRATAWVRYDYPTKDQLTKIWQVLSNQYSAKLSEATINGLVERFPRVTGRNVKSLLKLARKIPLAKRHPTIDDVGVFEYVSEYLDLGPHKGRMPPQPKPPKET